VSEENTMQFTDPIDLQEFMSDPQIVEIMQSTIGLLPMATALTKRVDELMLERFRKTDFLQVPAKDTP
jgi:hypothetical protein